MPGQAMHASFFLSTKVPWRGLDYESKDANSFPSLSSPGEALIVCGEGTRGVYVLRLVCLWLMTASPPNTCRSTPVTASLLRAQSLLEGVVNKAFLDHRTAEFPKSVFARPPPPPPRELFLGAFFRPKTQTLSLRLFARNRHCTESKRPTATATTTNPTNRPIDAG